MSHTPRPWTREGMIVSSGRGIIARIATPRDGGVFECSANADLIGCAPDLLAALEAALQFMEDNRPQYLAGEPSPHKLIAGQIRDAIARAKGKL